MRLPWEQITMEVIEVSAPELAAKLDISEAEAGWGIILVIKWALARCPDHQPPSANAVVMGASAARQIARAAGYRGDPEVYAKTAAGLSYPILEMQRDGIRIRGLDRYDASWGDRNKEAWNTYKAAHPDRYPPEPRRKSAGDPPEERRPDPDADADPDAEEDADRNSPQPPSLKEGGEKKTRRRRRDRTPHLLQVPPAPPTPPWSRDTPAGHAFTEVLNRLRHAGAAYAVSQLERLVPELAQRAGRETLVLRAADEYFGPWCEEHYLGLLRDATHATAGPPIALEYPPKRKPEEATA